MKAEQSPIKGARKIHAEKLNKIIKIGKNLNTKEANFEFVGIAYFSQKGAYVLKEAYLKRKKTQRKKKKPVQ